MFFRNSRAPLDDSYQTLKTRRLDTVISHQEFTEPGTIRTIKLLKDRDNVHQATPREFELAELVRVAQRARSCDQSPTSAISVSIAVVGILYLKLFLPFCSPLQQMLDKAIHFRFFVRSRSDLDSDVRYRSCQSWPVVQCASLLANGKPAAIHDSDSVPFISFSVSTSGDLQSESQHR